MQPDTAPWDEAVERNVFVAPIANSELQRTPAQVPFATPAEQIEEGGTLRVVQDIHGLITLGAAPVAPDVWRISLQVTNTTESQSDAREDVLRQSLVSAHAIVQVTNGELISLLEPPPHLAEAAAACRNHGVFPVLAGERLRPDTMLISPIILYDYPETAAESSGDFFDATEIDEMLTLRVLTLSNEEKEQMRNGDQRAREILERTSGIGEEQLLKIHGAVRGLRRAERKS
jgi:hypothetical protein